MSKKKSRRQRKQPTTKSITKTSVASTENLVEKKPETSVAAVSKENEQGSVGLDYIRGDIRKTVFLSGFILVFYTMMYFILQRTNLLEKATQLLRLGS